MTFETPSKRQGRYPRPERPPFQDDPARVDRRQESRTSASGAILSLKEKA
jgi:hypothetical protein